MGNFFLGLDLGQRADPTCAVILERFLPPSGFDYAKQAMIYGAAQYHLRFLEQPALGTNYPAIVLRVKELLGQDPLRGNARLVVDATGCGLPVVDMFRVAGLAPAPVMITGGDKWSLDRGIYRVPKRDLVAVVQVLLQNDRLKFAGDLPHLKLLQKELTGFKVKIDPKTAHDSYSNWRDADHDDMVLAVALACWFAERGIGQRSRSVSTAGGTGTAGTRAARVRGSGLRRY